MNIVVTVKYLLKNVCTEEELEKSGLTLEQYVKRLIENEGLIDVAIAEAIVKVEKV